MSEQSNECKGSPMSFLDGDTDEQQPFLQISRPSTEGHPDDGHGWPFRRRAPLLVSVAANVVLTAILFVTWITTRNKRIDAATELSPASHLIQYERLKFQAAIGNDTSPYQGWPNDDIDAHWQEMYNGGTDLGFSELDVAGLQLPDDVEKVPVAGFEDRYLGTLDVFHQLHCLNIIRMGYFPERYNSSFEFPNGKIDKMSWKHIDHCIEVVRQRVTCSADVEPQWYRWSEEKEQPKLVPRIGITHTCRNFDVIRDWALKKRVPGMSHFHRVVDGVIEDRTPKRVAEGEHVHGHGS